MDIGGLAGLTAFAQQNTNGNGFGAAQTLPLPPAPSTPEDAEAAAEEDLFGTEDAEGGGDQEGEEEV